MRVEGRWGLVNLFCVDNKREEFWGVEQTGSPHKRRDKNRIRNKIYDGGGGMLPGSFEE